MWMTFGFCQMFTVVMSRFISRGPVSVQRRRRQPYRGDMTMMYGANNDESLQCCFIFWCWITQLSDLTTLTDEDQKHPFLPTHSFVQEAVVSMNQTERSTQSGGQSLISLNGEVRAHDQHRIRRRHSHAAEQNGRSGEVKRLTFMECFYRTKERGMNVSSGAKKEFWITTQVWTGHDFSFLHKLHSHS